MSGTVSLLTCTCHAAGKYHSYFTILIHLNSIDDLCGGTEIWSKALKRGDMVSACGVMAVVDATWIALVNACCVCVCVCVINPTHGMHAHLRSFLHCK